MFLVQLDSFNSELWNIAIGFALHKRAVASLPSVIPTSSGSLWFVDRDWKIVCSNNHKSNNPPLLLVEAASFDASVYPPSNIDPAMSCGYLQVGRPLSPLNEVWWTILRVFDGIWFLVGCCSAMFCPFLAHIWLTIADHQPSAAAFIFAIAKVPACKDHGAGYQIYWNIYPKKIQTRGIYSATVWTHTWNIWKQMGWFCRWIIVSFRSWSPADAVQAVWVDHP